MTPAQRLWLKNALRYGGSFVKTFATAAMYADDDNYALLESVLEQLMAKYPKYSQGENE